MRQRVRKTQAAAGTTGQAEEKLSEQELSGATPVTDSEWYFCITTQSLI